jgi:hypothetical protein
LLSPNKAKQRGRLGLAPGRRGFGQAFAFIST